MKLLVPPTRWLAVIAVLALAALDLGRSLYVRSAFNEPATVWQPDPKDYADTRWPPSSMVTADMPIGQKVYVENCAICHGPDGRGNGASAPSMIPRPRDFTLGEYKYKSTAFDQSPTDDDLINTVANGLTASGMPYWRDILKDTEIRAVVDYIKSMSPVFQKPPPAPLTIPPRIEPTPESIARGQKIFAEVGCSQCHGAKLRGGLEETDKKNYPVVSRDLTAPWTFRGGAKPETLWLRLTTGLAPGPMPSYADVLTPSQRWDVVNFITANAAVPAWQAGGELRSPGLDADLRERGRHLVHSEMCGLCHTEVNPGGIYRDDRYLAGGMRVGARPQGVFISRNLTPDRETGLGNWSEAQIADAIRNGKTPEGRLLNLWGMPWMYLHNLSNDDATAIARYLTSLKPIHNAIPQTLHYGFAETVYLKLIAGTFPVAPPPVLTYAIGSYANRTGIAPDLIQRWLVNAQWLVLVAALVALPFSMRRQRTRSRSATRWLMRGVGVIAGVGVGLAGWFVYNMPTLGILPPDRVAQGASASIYTPDVSQYPPEHAAMVARGRYLFSIASCAYCHLNDGSGGFKVSGRNGSIFTPNISSDKSFGIGSWSDDEIARAIRSGVSKNGRPLYWQGMPWDHFSNFDEEDVRSLIAYLRAIPPVNYKVPAYRAPASDDCREYTFWTHKTQEYGCKG